MRSYTLSDLFKTDWQQLSPRAMARVIYWADRLQASGQTQAFKDWGFASIYLLRTLRKNKRAVAKINVEQAVDVVNNLRFIHKPWYFFPVRTVRYWFTRYHAPLPKLDNLTFEQFKWADASFTKYLVTQHPEALCELIACLYLKKGEAFSRHIIDTRKHHFARLATHKKLLIFRTYANTRAHIIESCPHLFVVPSTPEQTTPTPQLSGQLWQQLHYDLAESDAFKGYDASKQSNFWEVLIYLDRKLKQKPNNKTN